MNKWIEILTKELLRAFSLSMLVVSFMLSPIPVQASSTHVVEDSDLVLPKAKTTKELEIEARTEQAIVEQFGENIGLLKAMVEDINKNSYQATLRLCHGYRKFAGIGSIPVLSKKYKISTADSFWDWMNIGKHGFAAHMQTYVNGGKMVHNEIFNRSALEFDHYFGSVYLFYLFRSDGYNKAAKDCLSIGNTGKYSQTHYDFFKKMLVAMDNLGSGVGVTASFMAAGAIISKLIYPAAVKIGLASAALAAKVGAAIGLGATAILAAKVVVVGAVVIGAAYLLYKLGTKAYERYQIFRIEKEMAKNPNWMVDFVESYDLSKALEEIEFVHRSLVLYRTAVKKHQEGAKDRKLYPMGELKSNYKRIFELSVLKKESKISKLCEAVEPDRIKERNKFMKYLKEILAFENKEIENCI